MSTRCNAEVCPIFDATKHVDPFVPKIKKKNKVKWIVFCFLPNWLSSFEMKEQATCLTWFRGLSCLKWREASRSFLKRKNPLILCNLSLLPFCLSKLYYMFLSFLANLPTNESFEIIQGRILCKANLLFMGNLCAVFYIFKLLRPVSITICFLSPGAPNRGVGGEEEEWTIKK